MKLEIAAALVMALILFTPAASAYQECVNSSYRTWTDSWDEYINGSFSRTVTENGTEPCPYGCVYGQCAPVADNGSALALALLFGFAFLGVLYLGLKIGGPASILSWLFIPIAITLLVPAFVIQVNTGVHTPANNNILIGIAWAFIIVVLFLIAFLYITLIRGGIKQMLPYSRKLKPVG